MRKSVLVALFAMMASPVFAYTAVKDEAQFRSLIEGKSLSIFLYGLSLNVQQNGTITGKAVGSPITGSWSWNDGYFCRDMKWGSREIEYNCQLVEYNGSNRMRFTTDQGAGDSADFRLK
ncbi:MAG: dihydrodipicolinate reductase [Planktomarina sp.]